MEHGKVHFADVANVAHIAVGDAARRAARACRGRQQLAPGRNARRSATAQHRDVVRLQIVDERDLELVRILARNHLIDFAIDAGASEAHERQRVVERPNRRRKGLVAVAELVEDV